MQVAPSPAPRIAEVDISGPARALAILRWSDYVLVVVCGYMALGLLFELVSNGAEDAASMVFDLVYLSVLAFAAHTGWRHLGTIDPKVWRAYKVVFPLLLLLAAIVIGSFIATRPASDDSIDRHTFVGLFVLAWVATMSLPAFIAVMLLPRMRLASIDMRLSTLLEQVRRRGGDAGVHLTGLKRINPLRGTLFAAAGLLVIVAVMLAPEPADEKLAGSTARMGPQLSLIGFFLLLRARRHFQISADSLLAADKRAPILFLRSFDDDEKQVFGAADRALLDFSLETRLANHFHRFGPFVAIGSPKESVPQLGAARVLLPDDQWQERVLGWMRDAAAVVMYSGKTAWVNWELRQVIESGHAGRLILLIPEIKGRRSKTKKQDLRARVEQLRVVFKDTPWAEELEAWRDFNGLRAMLFRLDGSMVMIKSRSKSRDSYHLAALVAHELLLAPVAVPELPAAAFLEAA